MEKIDTKEKIVVVTITPSSLPEQRNRAAERGNALKQKCSLPLVARLLADFFAYYAPA